MKLEEIEVTIGADGKVRVRTDGFSGETCLDATADLEQLLGDKVVSREMRPEALDPVRIGKTAEKLKLRR